MDAKELARRLQATVEALEARVAKLENDAVRNVDAPRIGPTETKPASPTAFKDYSPTDHIGSMG